MKNLFILSLSILLIALSCQQDQSKNKLILLSTAVEDNLYNNIIPFWTNYVVDEINGGFYGTVDAFGVGDTASTKGVILNARILWTYSALYIKDKDSKSLEMARRAYEYLVTHFIDQEYGGAFYMVDNQGHVVADNKNTYANSFVIYGLSEYYRAVGEETALEYAKTVFTVLDKYAHDETYGGYNEFFMRDWSPAPTRNNIEAGKTMNTSLHVMEALANLYRVWNDPLLESRLQEMITLFLDKIINPETHLQNYAFTRDWTTRSNIKSYGHDIESSWLLLESAEILGNEELIDRCKVTCLAMAEATVSEALGSDGRLIYETVNNNESVKFLQWWAQAEAIVGFVNAWQLSGDEVWLDRALLVWKYTDDTFVDKEHGEWYYGFDRNGVLDKSMVKVDAWKCPYHNSRMCMEVIRRAQL